MANRAARPSRPAWVVPVAVLSVVAVLAAVVLLLQPSGTKDTAGRVGEPVDPMVPAVAEVIAPGADGATGQGVEQIASAAERRDPADPLALGPVDAPVVLVVFSDYQCPFCAAWSQRTLPVMLERAEAGELRIEWRDVNIFGEDSARAARAAYAAALQDRFLDYHHLLFADGDTRSDLSDTALEQFAVELDLDLEKFRADRDDPATAAAVLENQTLGTDLGVMSTPSFLLGGTPVVGAQPTEVFLDAHARALAGS